MKIVSVIGARPQFIKSAPVSEEIAAAGFDEFKIHTGQHYDYEMSQIFFDELSIPEPNINLGIRSSTHARQSGEMLIAIESVLTDHNPDVVIVYGDTNSTLAGALAAIKLNIKVGHIEAGLRSYNRRMPEEHNRVLTDHCSDFLFCPTQTAVNNLDLEGIRQNVFRVGDTMYDAVLRFAKLASERSNILSTLAIFPNKYLLATIHRAYNTDDISRLGSILNAFQHSSETIILPIHPRTLKAIQSARLSIPKNVLAINPVGYLDMLMLEQNARMILTDSGGIQKEAYFFRIPCLTLRPETEWVETVSSGWNVIVDVNIGQITKYINQHEWPKDYQDQMFGDGQASQKIVGVLKEKIFDAPAQ